jgi:hypothetical protein
MFWRRASAIGFEGLKRLAVVSALAVAAQKSPVMRAVFILASVLFALPIGMAFQDWLASLIVDHGLPMQRWWRRVAVLAVATLGITYAAIGVSIKFAEVFTSQPIRH